MTETLRDNVLATLPPETHTAFLRLALDAGVHNPDDAAWGDVALAYAASVSAAAATAAAVEVKSETAKIPEAIYQGTIRAGQDLRGQVEAAGKSVIEAATAEVASTLRQAVQGMDANAKARIDQIVACGIADVTAAVRADARASVAGRMARSWGMVAGLLTFFMVLGGTVTWGGLYATHHVTPMNMPILLNSSGGRQCGTLRSGTEACLIHINP